MATRGAVHKPTRSWAVTVLVLASGWLLLYATRTVLSSAVKEIGEYWGLSQGWLGVLSSAFFMSYTFLQVPGGVLADKLGPKRMLMAGFGIQAFGLILGALSNNHFQFLFSRLVTGAGQATYFACQQSIVSRSVPLPKRSLGVSITTAGAGLGSAAGFMLGRFLSAGDVGWRMPFTVLGIISLAFIGAVFALVPESGGENDYDRAGRQPESSSRLTTVSLGLLCAAHFLTMYGFYLMLTWLPYYLETVRGLVGSLPALIPVGMALAMAPATVVGGIVAGKHQDKTAVSQVAIPLSAIAILAVPMARSTAVLALVVALYGATGKLVIDPGLVSTIADNAAPERRATTLAVFNFAGSIAMATAPAITGFVAQATGSFNVSFYLAGAFNLLGLIAFIAGSRSIGSAVRDAEREGLSASEGK